MEIIVCLSGIHSEIYNRKVLNKFNPFADGLVVSHLDLCMNYGSILNVHIENSRIPLMFFGTGETVPDDIETATCERLIAGLFKL